MEARLKRLVTVLAFLSSFAALIVVAGGGLALFAIEVSGERGMGALLALCGGVAFAAVMALIFARRGNFGEGAWKAIGIAAAVVGAAPAAVIAVLAIRFAGFPLDSRVPLLDWSALGAGSSLASVRFQFCRSVTAARKRPSRPSGPATFRSSICSRSDTLSSSCVPHWRRIA